MKRLTAILLSIALLLTLCACGAKNESASSAGPTASAPPEVSTVENEAGYVIPSAWTETSINDGTWGYVTAAAELPTDASYGLQDDYLVAQEVDQETKINTISRCTLNGTELCRVEIPPMETGENIDTGIGAFCFGDDSLWLIHYRYLILDESAGEVESYLELQQWSCEGQCLTAVPIDSSFGQESGEPFVMGLDLSPDGSPILITENHIYFCDGSGQPTAYMETAGTFYALCRDSAGRLYLYDQLENQVYTIDWENHGLGDALFTLDLNEAILPGGGDYDFFLKSDTSLRGVTLETGSITEILSWGDWDLAGCVGGVTWLDDETFLISTYSLLDNTSEILTLSRVPAAEIPEKATVRMAAALSADSIEWGETWANVLDQRVTEAINQFNRASSTYRVAVETYSSGEELNLKLLSGDAPDIICWNSTVWLEDTPSMAIYAKRGYLVDLAPLFASDPELSTDDFIPNILELSSSRTGGLYTAPTSFSFHTWSAPIEYVGTDTGWTVSDMLAVAKTLPEDMNLWDDTQSSMLDILLRTNINSYVDIAAGTCDFENQAFYDTLTLCRDYFPAEYTESGKTPLLMGHGSTMWEELASDALQKQGRTLIGYPGAGGSGVSVIFNDDFGICSLGQQQEGAWAFLRTLWAYDFQSGTYGTMFSVRQDAFNDKLSWRREVNSAYTETMDQTVRELVYGAQNVRTNDSTIIPIIQEEAAAFFNGDKTAEETARIIQNRISIYLGEQS